MLANGSCRETVSILEAMTFGTHGACVDLGMWSVITAVSVFCLLVVALKILGKVTLVALFGGLRIAAQSPESYGFTDPPAFPDGAHRVPLGQVADDGGPIRSTGAWGRKA